MWRLPCWAWLLTSAAAYKSSLDLPRRFEADAGEGSGEAAARDALLSEHTRRRAVREAVRSLDEAAALTPQHKAAMYKASKEMTAARLAVEGVEGTDVNQRHAPYTPAKPRPQWPLISFLFKSCIRTGHCVLNFTRPGKTVGWASDALYPGQV